MKILVVGKGGREHAIIQALNESSSAPTLFACPGSDAISTLATCFPFESMDALTAKIKAEGIDFVIAGEESYLANGLADRCYAADIAIWGPTQHAAQLESSKIFAKEFMVRHRVPTGGFTIVHNSDEARAAITSYPTVLKYNGLAAGKGVAVCFKPEEVDEFLNMVFEEKRFGDDAVFVEEFLSGKEVSIICAVANGQYTMFTPARDYKRLGENDAGPNTGGMGAVATKDLVGSQLLDQIERDVVQPTIKGLVTDQLNYHGFLYFGIILTPTGPQVLEFNCRFGDPEAQAVLSMIQGDFATFLAKGAAGDLDESLLNIAEGWSVCLVRASAGYPATSRNGDVIAGLDDVEDGRVYHAGTRKNTDGQFETNGGRVLAVVAKGKDRQNAVDKAYAEFAKVTFDGCQQRSDIGTLHFEETEPA